MSMSKEAQEIGQRIYDLMAQIPGITEDKRRKVTGTMLDSIELDDLQIIVKNQAALNVLIDKSLKAYNCHLEGKEEETPAQVVAAALAVVAAAQAAAAAPPAKAPSPQHKQRQHQQRQRRQGPTRLQRAAMAVSTVASVAAAIVSDFKSLPGYVGSTLGMLWEFPKIRWFEQNLYEYAVKPFYGMLWGTCPTKDNPYRFLFFPKDEKAPDLKKKYSSFVIVTALHCIFNNTALGHLGIQCMFGDENKIVEQVEMFMKIAIKRYIAEYCGSFIINGFKDCVQYIHNHGNVKDAKNLDATINQRVDAVLKLFAEATTDKTGATIDEMCSRLAELTVTVAAMKTKMEQMEKTQKQTARRLGEVHAEVVVLRKKVDKVAEVADETVAMLAQWGIGQSSTEGR